MVGPPVEFDTVLELCRDQHRRIVLAVLADEKRPLTVNDLTKTILRYNHQTPLSEVSEEVLSQVRLSLHHVHVPMLETAELVEYDTDRHLVVPTERFDELEPHLSAIVATDPVLESPVEL